MLQTETQAKPVNPNVTSCNATSFFVPPELKVIRMKISRRSTSFTAARSSVGVEGCQSHVIALTMNHYFPVTVSFIVLARCYGHKEAYNKAQLQIMNEVYENEIFMRKTLLKAGSAISPIQQDVSFFFTFERQGLTQANIYLTLKVMDMDDLVTSVKEGIDPEDAQDVMRLMLDEMVS